MKSFLQNGVFSLLANALSLWGVASFLPERIGIFSVPEWKGFLLVGFTLGLLNTFVKPILRVLSLPFVFLTMGIFLVFLNAVMLFCIEWLYDGILSGLDIQVTIQPGILNFVFVGFVLGALNTAVHWVLRR